MRLIYEYDPILRTTYYIGISAILSAYFSSIYILFLRFKSNKKINKQKKFNKRWLQLLADYVTEEIYLLPKIKSDEMYHFWDLWLNYRTSLKGESGRRINEAGILCNLPDWLIGRLKKVKTFEQVRILNSLGLLKIKSCWKEYVDCYLSPNPILAETGLKAMVQCDPDKAIPYILNYIENAQDWHLSRIVAILREAGAERISAPLIRMLSKNIHQPHPKHLWLLEVAFYSEANKIIHTLLKENHDIEVLSVCLQLCKDPALKPCIKEYLTHPTWFIRGHAASAMSRIGIEKDTANLIPLISDPYYWVRYHAALAIAQLLEFDSTKIETLKAELEDRFAIDMLIQIQQENKIL